MKLVVAISGASGVVYGIRVLEELKKKSVETHLIVSRWGQEVIKMETGHAIEYVNSLASYYYTEYDLAAPITSGSFACDGMLIVPCSMKTLAGISSGYADTVLLRAADVMIKERRRLVLVVRETPLSPIHLDNMLKLSKIGVTIFPPLPAFYIKQETIEDLIRNTVGRILDQFGIHVDGFVRWGES
jgi:polyprenyl P-hydroxybenzoate/phenylacrylic acid decarboxylase-like protein